MFVTMGEQGTTGIRRALRSGSIRAVIAYVRNCGVSKIKSFWHVRLTENGVVIGCVAARG
jgi:hypothetical protein